MNIVENTILKRFNSEWSTSSYSTVPVAYENQAFDSKNVNSFVRITSKNVNSKQRSLGSAPDRKWDRFGFLVLEVFVKPNTSTYTGKDMCETIINMFEGSTIDNIYFDEGNYKSRGVVDNWFSYIGTVRWTYQDHK